MINLTINRTTCLIFLILLAPELPCQIYVDVSNTSGIEDGETWVTAFSRLNTAIEIAQSQDEIWVRQGIYTPVMSGDRHASFTINKGIKLYGGFSGQELSVTDRNPSFHSTLSGDIGLIGDHTDNSFTIMKIDLINTTSIVIDGFIFEEGTAVDTDIVPGFYHPGRAGGAVFVEIHDVSESTPLQFVNCIFQRNSAITDGGAVFFTTLMNETTSLPVFVDCAFKNNSAFRDGGAVSCAGTRMLTDVPFIVNSIFEDNVAFTGGAIKCNVGTGYFMVSTSRFLRNISRGSGGALTIAMYDTSVLKLTNLEFYRNGANLGSGADAYLSTDFGGRKVILIDSCYSTESLDIRNDTIRGYGQFIGGTLITEDLQIHVSNCRVHRSGMRFDNGGFDFNVSNSYFVNAPDIVLSGAENIFIHNTVFSNSSLSFVMRREKEYDFVNVVSYNLERGFLQVSGDTTSKINVYNSIFYTGDSAPEGYLLTGGNIQLHLINCLLDKGDLDNSVKKLLPTQKLPSLDTSMILLGRDPRFLDPVNLDFRIAHCSPAVNMGNTDILTLKSIVIDIYGNARIRENVVDIGVYEVAEIFAISIDSIFHNYCGVNGMGIVVFSVQPESEPFLAYLVNESGEIMSEFSGLEDGEYMLHVQSTQNCKDSTGLSIENSPALTAIVLTQMLTCSDRSDGVAEVVILSGSPPYELLWSTGSASEVISDLSKGDYRLTITDAQKCTLIDTAVVVGPETMIIQSLIVDPSHSMASDGAIVVSVSGGSPPYTLLWNNGEVSGALYGLDIGAYSVTVTDRNGCTIAETITLTGIHDIDDGIQVYPNPASAAESLVVEYYNDRQLDILDLKVYDMTGRPVFSNTYALGIGLNVLDVKLELPSALYLLTFAHTDKVFKIVVMN